MNGALSIAETKGRWQELQRQAERFGTDVRIGHVTRVELNPEKGKMHTVTIDENNIISYNFNHADHGNVSIEIGEIDPTSDGSQGVLKINFYEPQLYDWILIIL